MNKVDKKAMLASYEKANSIIKGFGSNDVVRNDVVFPHWASCSNDSCVEYLWYRKAIKGGIEYRLVDIEAASNSLLFNHNALSKELIRATGESVSPYDLPLSSIKLEIVNEDASLHLYFSALNKYWLYIPGNTTLKEIEPPLDPKKFSVSPDGSKAVFIRNHNLWIRELANGEECALTQDGTEECSYASNTSNPGRVDVLWSADSQRILATQLDTQGVRVKPNVSYVPGDGSLYQQLQEIKHPYPGDENIFYYCFSVISIDTGQKQSPNYPPIPYVICGIYHSGFFDSGLGWWSADGGRAFFVDAPRDSRVMRVIEWDTHSGDVRVVMEESDDITVRLRHKGNLHPLILPLPETDELIWFSERTGWAHFYLYNLKSGELKNPITDGDCLVQNLLSFNAKRRELLIQTSARDQSISPYYRDICKVNIDTGELLQLVGGNFEYTVDQPEDLNSVFYSMTSGGGSHGVSMDGQYIVTTRSRPDSIPVTVLIDNTGKERLTLEVADTSGLPEDWQWPEPVKLKASDNITDIYAVVFRPPGFSPEQSYPVIDFNASTRNDHRLPSGSFTNNASCGARYWSAAALAALGFIVVIINGRGTSNREKSFYTHHFGDYSFSNDFTDRIAGIRELASRYPYMDINRVGISVNENPISNAIYGLLDHSDFYSVAVIHGMMDPRYHFANLVEATEVAFSETAPAHTPYPEECVESFNGKLMLIFGLGQGAIPSSPLRLVEALSKANKDVDMVVLPNMHHAYTSYTLRREWDYLVTHLQGNMPPQQFLVSQGIDSLKVAKPVFKQ